MNKKASFTLAVFLPCDAL